MNNLTNILEYQKQIISLEAKVEAEIEFMLVDFDKHYYFEIDITQGNSPDCKVIWLSFCLPVLNSQPEKEIIEIGFTVELNIRDNNDMTNLQFIEQRAILKKNAAILMFLGRDVEHFSSLPKMGTISKSDIEERLQRCYVSFKRPTEQSSFPEFVSQVTQDYIMPFLKNTKFSKYNDMVKPNTTKVIQELTKLLPPIVESLSTKELVSPEINRLFFKDIVSALEGHEKVASFKRLNSQLPTKTDNMKIKI